MNRARAGMRRVGAMAQTAARRVGIAGRWALAEIDLGDVVLMAGIGCLGYGLALWSIPLAWICVGLVLVCLAWPESPAAPPKRERSRGD